MNKQIFAILFFFSAFLSAQTYYESFIKSEQERYSRVIKISEVQYPGDSKIDVTYYGLDLTVTANPNYLSGSVIIGIQVDTSSINSCFLDLQNALTINSVLLNGTPAVFTHINNIITVTLDRTYVSGEEFFIKVFYQGIPGSSGLGSFEFSAHSGVSAIWTLSEPYGAPDWFPCKDTPADKADSSDVWITVSDQFTAVSNGTLESEVNNGNGTKTFYWKNHYTIAHYLISLAITNYHRYDTYFHYGQNDSMIITHFVYPEQFNLVKPHCDETAAMISVFSDCYGLYPFIDEKYGHAQFGRVGMEHQTCTSIGLWETWLVAHELAHQWYGDMITCADWHNIWLNEGFATYSEAVYVEAKNGKAAYNSYVMNEMNQAKNAQGSIWVQDISEVGQIFDWYRTYKKAGVVLHMLRGVVGDSTFFDIMRTYSADTSVAYGVATTEDFQAIAESVYGQSLNYFFQQWIYGEKYPIYSVTWSKTPLGGEAYQIHLNITQTVNPNPAFFTMPVQIKVNFASGDTLVTLFNDAQSQDFQFDIIENPTSIDFDPGKWILKTLQSLTEVEDIYQPIKYSLEQNYPNPFNPRTVISYQLPVSGNVSLRIYDVLGNEVAILIDGYNEAGKHKVDFDATGLNSGVYFYKLLVSELKGKEGKAGEFVETKKMILIK